MEPVNSTNKNHQVKQFTSSKRTLQTKGASQKIWTKYFYENGDVRYRAQLIKLKDKVFVKLSKKVLDDNNLKYQKSNKTVTLCADAWREFKNCIETLDEHFN